MNDLNNIKIVFLDIDGTLTNSKGRITLKTRKTIKKLVEKGIYVVLVTGRGALFTIKMSRKALASKIVIFSNGSCIYDYKNGKILYGDTISFDELKQIYSFCESNHIKVIFNSEKDVYVNKYMIGSSKINKIITDVNELRDISVIQITFQVENEESKKMCIEMINKLDLKISYLSKGYSDNDLNSIDVNNTEVSKGKAVKYLLNYLNIKKEESLCFGDYTNDIEMFLECGYKVAMGNASDDIKELSDFITLSNDKNGISYFINKRL